MKAEYTARELSGVLDISVTAVHKIAARNCWIVVDRKNPCGGGFVKHYQADSFDEATALAIGKAELGKSIATTTCTLLSEISSKNTIPVESMNEPQLAKAAAKSDLVLHYMQSLKKAPYGGKGPARDKFMAAYNSGYAYPGIYAVLGELSWKTIEGWKRTVKAGGSLSDLADTRGKWKRGKSIVTARQAAIIAQCALHPNAWLPAEIIREAKSRMAEIGIHNGHSTATYYRWLNDFKAHNYAIWCWCRGGKKRWNDECCLSIDRDPTLIDVGDVLVADGHKLNFEILNPWTGKAQRMILIVFYDMRSSYPCGWEIMPTENTAAISAALRRAIMTLGKIPKVVYLDNGRAFKSKYFTGTNLEEGGLSGLYAQLGIQTVFAWAYHGQSKTVERFFGTTAELERKAPTYSGTSIDAKPPRINRGERLHRRIYEAVMAGQYITLEMAHRAVATWFDDYACRPQEKSKYLKGYAPIDLFEKGRGEGVDPMQLTYLMWAKKDANIRASRIEAFGRYYYNDALYNRRHQVEIRYDLQDPSYIVVFERGEFLCVAAEQDKVHPMARILGTEDDQKRLAEYCEIKGRQEKEASGIATRMLEQEVLPDYRRRLAYEGVTPTGLPAPEPEEEAPKPITAAERERIEAEAAAYQSEDKPADIWDGVADLSEVERYEQLIKFDARGMLIPKEHQAFMRYFEQTAKYATLERQDYWEQVRAAEAILSQATGGS